jgi:hypothetical protein
MLAPGSSSVTAHPITDVAALHLVLWLATAQEVAAVVEQAVP